MARLQEERGPVNPEGTNWTVGPWESAWVMQHLGRPQLERKGLTKIRNHNQECMKNSQAKDETAQALCSRRKKRNSPRAFCGYFVATNPRFTRRS